MKKSTTQILMIILLSVFTGWSGPLDVFGTPEQKVSDNTSPKIQGKKSIFNSTYYLKTAHRFEHNDELQVALFYLQVASALNPDNKEIIEKISDLKLTINKKSNTYFTKANKLYSQKNFEAARNNLLTVLRYNPDHKAALDYLKNRLIPKEYINYTFKKNDSLKAVSNKFYNNTEWVFLIEYFNHLKSDTEPEPGKILIIPLIEPEFNQSVDESRQNMDSARNMFAKNKFPEVLVITQKILKNDPLNKNALKLKNEAYFQIGTQLIRHEKYFEAIGTFKKITPEHKDVNNAIQNALQHELLNAENLIKAKKYEESLNLAKRILAYDPSNTAAKKLIDISFCRQARDLIVKKKYDDALRVLKKSDPASHCTKKTRLAVKTEIKQQAETHYIQGVKHFLNEELQGAIKEWEMTLKLNPEHDKAKKNIKNAKSLLEKLKKVK